MTCSGRILSRLSKPLARVSTIDALVVAPVDPLEGRMASLRVIELTSALLERLHFLVPDSCVADCLPEFANHPFRPSP